MKANISIQNMSRALGLLAIVTGGLTLLSGLSPLFNDSARLILETDLGEVELRAENLRMVHRIAITLILMIPECFGLAAVVQIFSLSRLYSHGQIFTQAAIHRLRNFSLMLILLAVSDPFCYVGALGYIHLRKVVEGVTVSLDLDALSDSVEIIFVGLIFLVISKVMTEAVRLEEEVRLTV